MKNLVESLQKQYDNIRVKYLRCIEQAKHYNAEMKSLEEAIKKLEEVL